MLIKPRPVRAGDTLGIIALSAPCEEQRLKRGVAQLEKLGFKTRIALNPCAQYGKKDFLFSSASAKDRARALHDLMRDPQVAAILSARGAYGSMEVLAHLDFSLLRDNPKILCGFSDTTAVLMQLYGRSGVAALHGPSLESCFSKMETGEHAARSAHVLIKMLSGELQDPFGSCSATLLCGGGTGEGPLIGGNLSMLVSLVGTPWDVDWRGHVLFIEEAGEKPYRIHRMLLQLKSAGKLSGLRAVALGSFRDCVHPHALGPELAEVLKDAFAEFGYPVIEGLPFGHEELNLPVPIGAAARVSANKLELLESIVSLYADGKRPT